MILKPIYDLTYKGGNRLVPMTFGYFDKINKLSLVPWNDNDYFIIHTKRFDYRVYRKDYIYHKDLFEKFIERCERYATKTS